MATIAVMALAAGGLVAAAPAVAAGHRHHHHHHHRRHDRRHHRRHHHQAPRATIQAAQLDAPAPPASAPVPAVCTDADTPATSASSAVMDAAVVCLINQQRVSRGLPALWESSQLDTSAQSWTDHMVSADDFSHGSDFAGRISAVGYDWQDAGENIATGFATPREVVTAWMASPDHCHNILDPSFRDVGTGVNAAPVLGWTSDPATWTQDFGLTMSDSPLSSDTAPQSGCPYTI